MQYHPSVRAARLAAMISTIGASPKLLLFTGAVPSDCTQPDPSGLVATITLPSTWLAAPVTTGDVVTASLAGTWAGTSSAAGTIASFRIYDSGITFAGQQGPVSTVDAGTGDLQLTNTAVTSGQGITVAHYVVTSGNA